MKWWKEAIEQVLFKKKKAAWCCLISILNKKWWGKNKLILVGNMLKTPSIHLAIFQNVDMPGGKNHKNFKRIHIMLANK